MTFRRLLLLAFASLSVAAAAAQDDRPTRRIHLTVYGEDRCPRPSGSDEIVVCARRPEAERYRIPPQLRERRDRPTELSWQVHNEALEAAAREGRPDGCSVIGSGGQTGCTAAMIRQWLAERRSAR